MLKLKIPKEIDVNQDLFLLMMFDKLLEESELTEKEVDEIDHRAKRGIMESTGWK